MCFIPDRVVHNQIKLSFLVEAIYIPDRSLAHGRGTFRLTLPDWSAPKFGGPDIPRDQPTRRMSV